MKISASALRVAATILVIFSTSLVQAQLPAGSSIAIAPGTDGNAANVTVNNPGNHSWVMQQTTDLTTWTNVQTFKVHNGRSQRAMPVVGGANRVFYRSLYDPAAQTLTSTLANALLLPTTPFTYTNPALPPNLTTPQIMGQINTPANNPITNVGTKLGRVLFYDKRLSLNQTISCASCHRRENGFSDPNKFSTGFLGGLTGRNSMGLTSARYYLRGAFFWDERAATLEDQVLLPIQNSVEMGMTLTALETRLGAEPYYQNLFQQVFGTAQVTSARISFALAQFVRSIISTQTKYDIGVANGFTNFTAEENTGRQLFFGSPPAANCVGCHGTDNFVPGAGINNNGLENPYVDKGVGARTGLPQDEGLFKVGTLRNIELTAPYMHDGRFSTLEQVVEFYNSGVVAHPNLSPPLRNPPGTPGAGQPRRLNLTVAQKAALVAFMKTLTDTTIAADEKWADPFNYGN